VWWCIQVLWLARSVTPGLGIGPVEAAGFLILLLIILRCWLIVLEDRFSPIEVVTICLDAAAVALTVGAAVLMLQGPPAADSAVGKELLLFVVLFSGTVGGLAVLYVALAPQLRLDGWLPTVGGMMLLGGGMAGSIGSPAGEAHLADGIATAGGILIAYGSATLVIAPDKSLRFQELARRVRSALPLLAVIAAAALLLANELWLVGTDRRVALGVDVALALVLVNSVVRQTLMLRERNRLLQVATEAAGREAELLTDLRASEQRFRALVQNSSDVFLILGRDGTVTYQSPAVERVLGYTPDERVGRSIFELTHPEDIGFVKAAIGELMKAPGGIRTIELRSRHADGSWRVLEATGRNMFDDPMVGGLVVNYRDVTERKTLESQLIHEAFHDPLTGLANRALFTDRVEHALTRRTDVERVAVLFMDIDDFKTINDSLGHSAGDLVLVAVAERLRACLRAEDTVARLGGDEFAVLVEDATLDQARQLGERLLEAVGQRFEVAGKQVHLEASIGLAFASGDTRTANEQLRNADVAMYTAKNRGKGQVAVFEPSMHTAVLTRLELKADLERALAMGEFALRYQPFFDLRSGALAGFEALLRWRHPVRGETFPGDFIGLAEETGLIVPIGRWVLEETIRQAAEWHRAGHDLLVSANVSARQLREPDVVAWVDEQLRASGLPAERLIVELTESSLMQDDEGRLGELHARGLRLALDDFGTGYSSLSYLSRFPIGVLKIDRSFTASLGGDGDEAPLVRSVVQMAHAMEMRTVAEGIERAEQLARVRGLGCDYAQGFLLARPMDPERATSLVAARPTLQALLGSH
jgi:diguanylate cyclase (GGDEF)-like protein/PAS domain S-box-containing protein